MRITFVITTFNRNDCVVGAIASTLDLFHENEVVLIDDNSDDNTIETIKKTFKKQLLTRELRVKKLSRNVGVSGAKNIGYKFARGDWVVFLDSDDKFIRATAPEVLAVLRKSAHYPVVFFRCMDQYSCNVGKLIKNSMEIDLKAYVMFGSYGEVLTVINKKLIGAKRPYYSVLRGYEGLGICDLINRFGNAYLSPLIARVYVTNRDDSLSSFSNVKKRASLLAFGHRVFVNRYSNKLSKTKTIAYLFKAWWYKAISFI